MKIEFVNNGNVYSKISLFKQNDSVLLRSTNENDFVDVQLDKENLSNFIGQLLHLQSKLNKNG